ncbi:MAG: hypothetical protein H6704_14720 [Myxococcales bacterium]|nr:hypothetical protein [Myxococcales bacterium]
MSVRTLMTALTGALCLTLGAGCSDGDEDDARDRYGGADIAYERERWVGNAEDTIAELRRNVTALEVRAGTAPPNQQRAIRDLLHAVRDQLRELEARVEFAPALAISEWDAYRRGFEGDLHALRARVTRATERLGPPAPAHVPAAPAPAPDAG